MNQTTLWFMVGLSVIIIAFDVWRALKHDDSTISETIYYGSMKYPIIAFALGVLAGHLMWGQH